MAGSPYAKTYERVTQVMDRFFRYDAKAKTMTFVGDTLEARVPKRLESYNLLNVADTVTVLGVMDLIIDDTYNARLHMLAKFDTEPEELESVTVDGLEYMVLRYSTGARFIAKTQVVKNKDIIYAMYVEFITRGNLPYWYEYDNLAWLFDQAKSMCDAGLDVNRSIFEVINAHLARDAKSRFTQYRHTDMAGPFSFIPLRSISLAPDSTTARLTGSYFSEGLNSSLISTNTINHPFEDALRGLPIQRTDFGMDNGGEEKASILAGMRRRHRVENYALGPNDTLLASVRLGAYPLLPAGGIGRGETPELAAVRETAEEAGWTASNPKVLPVTGEWVFRGPLPDWMIKDGWDEEDNTAVLSTAGEFKPDARYGSAGDEAVFKLVPRNLVISQTEYALNKGTLDSRRELQAKFRLAALRLIGQSLRA